jgi:AbrB family looped-hinge helix DNA binding protein
LIDQERVMEIVIVSAKFQVIIPRRIREALGLRPGQKMQALQYGGRVELIPLVPLAMARGMFKDLTSDIERDGHRT